MNTNSTKTAEVLHLAEAPVTAVPGYLDDAALLDQIEELLVIRALTKQQLTAANMLDFFARNIPAGDPAGQAA